MTAKILWVNEEYDGPMNGFTQFNGNKLWFVRMNTPSIISTETLVSTNNDESERLYQLYRIDEESTRTLEENHERYCFETGAPLNHGDARKAKPKTETKTSEMKKFFHNLPKNVDSEYVTTLRESEFSNYLVPHRIEF